MKIDILLPTGRQGGVENMIKLFAEHLLQGEWNVRVVQLVWANETWLPEEIPFFPLLTGKGTYALDKLTEAYRDFLEKNDCPDVILATNWPYASYIGKTAAQLVQQSPKVISWLHAPLTKYQAGGLGDERALSYADGHLAISGEIYRELIRFFRKEMVERVNNAVDFPDEICHRNNEKEKRILYFIGRFEDEKRLDLILLAMGNEQVKKDWELFLIGCGESEREERQPHEWAKKYRAEDAVHWLGWQSEPWSFAKDADYIVMASDYEGSSLVVIEALSRGIGMITTPVGLAPEIIKPGINGYLFPCGDADALIEILTAIPRGVLPALSPEECRQSVQAFERETALQNMEQQIRKLMKG